MLTRRLLILTVLVAAAASISIVLAQPLASRPADPPAATATAPTTQGDQVPPARLTEMRGLLLPPTHAATPEQLPYLQADRMNHVLTLGYELERNYPRAENLNDMRLLMLRAAAWLDARDHSTISRKQVADVADSIMQSNASGDTKVQADFYLTRIKTGVDRGKPTADAAKEIQALADRYASTLSAVPATQAATVLALQANDRKLAFDLADRLYRTGAPEARAFLRDMGYFIGRPFTAQLTTLDGSKINLPEDTKGKIVVLEFWASWCAPCAAAAPYLKTTYGIFRPKGVEFIGVNLDDNRKDVEKFMADNKVTWTQAIIGRKSPLLLDYGIVAIPSVWVIGPDGNVITDNADPLPPPSGQGLTPLEVLLQKHAVGETTEPASQATSAPTTEAVW